MAIPVVNLRKRKLKKGHSYLVDYTINGDRYRQAVGKNKRDAESIKTKIQHELTLGNYDILTKQTKVITLDDLVKDFIEEKRNYIRPKTRNRYTNHFIPFKDFINTFFPKASMNISLIESRHIKECVDYIADGKADQQWEAVTINRMIQLISSLFIYAIKQKYRIDNPTVDVRKLPVQQKDLPEYFSESELQDLWNEITPYWVPFFRFLYYTGLRKGEAINLTWDKVNIKDKSPNIRIVSNSDWKTKTGKLRHMPLNQQATNILKNQKHKNSKYIFISEKGNQVHPNTPYNVLKRALKELKLTGDVHKFRHTFASHLVMKGANIYDVKELLGHSKIEMTEKYSHLSPEHKKKVVSLLK